MNCDPKWKRWCIACCSSQLWLVPAALLGVLILIEGIHTAAHLKMEQDVHGYCKQNAEHFVQLQDSLFRCTNVLFERNSDLIPFQVLAKTERPVVVDVVVCIKVRKRRYVLLHIGFREGCHLDVVTQEIISILRIVLKATQLRQIVVDS